MFADSGDVDAFDFEEGTGGRSLYEGADLVSSCGSKILSENRGLTGRS